jgi:tetratricopeptide (TPR) repeat protein
MFRVVACAASAAVLALASGASAQETDQVRTGPSVDEPSLYGAFLAGQAAIHAGDSASGARLLVEAAETRPDDATLRQRAFFAALINGDVTTAARYAPDDSDPAQVLRGVGQLTKAVEAMASGRGAEAETLLAGKQVPPPNHLPVLLLRPYAAAEAGDWAKATAPHDAEGERLVALIDRASRAELFELHGQEAEAEALYRELAADPVASAMFIVPCGEFLQRHGKVNDAIDLYAKALAKSPGDSLLRAAKARAEAGVRAPIAPSLTQASAEMLSLTAISMENQHQAELSLIYARLALRLNPAADQAWLMAGDAFTVAHDDVAARTAWANIAPASPLYVAARARYAYSLQRSGDNPGALAMMQSIARGHPNDVQAAFVLADVERSNDKFDDARRTLDQLVAGAGGSDWRVLFMRASVLDRLGHWDLAEVDLRKALTLAPNEPDLLNYLGYQWINTGEHVADGLKLVERAVAAKPNSGEMQDSLGWAHYRMGDYAKAVEVLEAAVTLEPDPKLKASVEAKLKDGLGPHSQIAGK